ncbi:unnamed protein product [Staurois parvus]|uniref:Uncharacterized protein n=1 Tax=Staurois parvus TaxID=386267 RepID=A0ABN9HCD1_9NEOB|nr:unnamed protein product [Staurois parvus]
MVGVTSQGSEQDKSGSNRVSNKTGTGMQEQDTGPRKNTHQGRVCRSGHPLNTPV